MEKIVVFPRAGVWMAERVGDSQVFDLFGCTVLETPFSTAMSAAEVCGELGALNPGASVDWFASEGEWRAEVLRSGGVAARMALA